MTAKEIVDHFNYNKERVEFLLLKKARITDDAPIKVIDYSEFGHGSGSGIEGKYCSRIEELQAIDNEVAWLRKEIEQIERVFSWIRKTNEEELDIMLYKYTYNKTNKEVAIQFDYCERTIERKIKIACAKLASIVN